MPIKGVSDKRRLPRLGKIRLGVKDAEKGFPKATDWFVCPPEVQAVFGAKPTQLRIMFLTEDSALWAQQWLRCYSNKRGLLCKGDGERATALVERSTGEIAGQNAKQTELREIVCDPTTCPRMADKACRRVMNLQFILPEVPGLGVWQVDTSSYNGILNLNSSLDMIRAVCGRVSWIPLVLSLEKQEIQYEGGKKKVNILCLRSDVSLADMQKLGTRPTTLALLPPPDEDEPDIDDSEESAEPERVDNRTEAEKSKDADNMEMLWDPMGQAGKAPEKVTRAATGDGNPAPVTQVQRDQIKALCIKLNRAWPNLIDKTESEAQAIIEQWSAKSDKV